VKTRIQNLEYRIQKVENSPRGEGSAVPVGRQAGLGTGLGDGVLEWCGKWSAGVSEYWGSRIERTATTPRPSPPEAERAKRSLDPIWGSSGVDLCGKKCGFLRIFPRFFTILLTDQGRNLASQARHELDAPNGLFAGAKRGRDITYFYG
jgi:hypothetical protein